VKLLFEVEVPGDEPLGDAVSHIASQVQDAIEGLLIMAPTRILYAEALSQYMPAETPVRLGARWIGVAI
jgi:hypothetical protein